jgi:hypothetical protein
VYIQVSLLSRPWSWQLTRYISVDAGFLSDKDTVRCSIRKGLCVITIEINLEPDAAISTVFYLTFIYSSTCFGRPQAHHQELNNCSSSFWFYSWSVVVAVLLVVVGPADRPDHDRQHCYHHFFKKDSYYLRFIYCSLQSKTATPRFCSVSSLCLCKYWISIIPRALQQSYCTTLVSRSCVEIWHKGRFSSMLREHIHLRHLELRVTVTTY